MAVFVAEGLNLTWVTHEKWRIYSGKVVYVENMSRKQLKKSMKYIRECVMVGFRILEAEAKRNGTVFEYSKEMIFYQRKIDAMRLVAQKRQNRQNLRKHR